MGQIRPIVIDDPQSMAMGPSRAAILAPAARYDSYQIGSLWHNVDDFSTWRYGQSVDAMSLWQRHPFAVGDILEIHELAGSVVSYAEIKAIRMIDCAAISDADIALLGYHDRDDWLKQTAGGLGGRQAWLLEVAVLEDLHPDLATRASARQSTEVKITKEGKTNTHRFDITND